MAIICSLDDGLNCPTCEEIQTKGGLVKNLYIAVRDDLNANTPFTTTANGTVEALVFNTYGFLYKFCAKNKSNSYNQELVVADNGLKFYNQTITGKFQQQTQDAKNTIDRLKVLDDLIVIVETNNGKFEVFGKETGLQITGLVKPSGITVGEDNSYTFTFSQPSGGEENLAPDMFITSYAATKALLESYLE